MTRKSDDREGIATVTTDAVAETLPPSTPFPPPPPRSPSSPSSPSSDGAAETLPARDGPAAPSAFRTVDDADYDIVGDIARGGMGRIRHARDRRHGRPVAIKELLEGSAEARERFRREALITARLQHPAIVPLYEAGTWPNGEPFYAMKLVDGESLEKVIERTATVAERIALLPRVITVVEAIAYAHDRRIIHRDLKPSNILVGDLGETVVIDWGLAKDLGARDGNSDDGDVEPTAPTEELGPASPPGHPLTVAGRAMGTPAYMPPEQARGDEVDERADVYALGAVLYHLLAGRLPYADARDIAELLERLEQGPPQPLRELAPETPRDLLTIVEKAMNRTPGDRYARARELAADLRRFEAGQLVGAHSYSTTEMVWRWVRRHRAIVAVAAVAATLAAVVAAVSFRRVSSERDAARRWARDSELARRDATDRVEQLTLERARSLFATDPTRAAELSRGIPADSRWSALAQLTATVAETWGVSTVLARGGEVSTLAASAHGEVIAWSEGTQVRLRRRDGTTTTYEIGAPISALAVSADGANLAAGTRDGRVYYGASERPPARLDGQFPDVVNRLVLDEPGLLIAGTMKSTWWWEVGSSPIRFVQPSVDAVADGPTARSDLLVVIPFQRDIEIWDRRRARLVRRLPSHKNSWTRQGGELTSDRSRVAYVSNNDVFVMHDLASGASQTIGDFGPRDSVRAWAGLVGDVPVVVDLDGEVHAWPRGARHKETIVEARPGDSLAHPVLAVVIHERRLILGFGDGQIAIIDPDRGLERTLRGHSGNVAGLAVIRDNDTAWLVSAGADGTVRRWSLGRAQERGASSAPREIVAIAVARSGYVAAASDDGILTLVPPGQTARRIDIGFVARDVMVSPDERHLLWSARWAGPGAHVLDLAAPARSPVALVGCDYRPMFTSTGTHLICSRAFDGVNVIWETGAWQPVARSAGGYMDSLAISSDGQMAAGGRQKFGIYLWLWDVARKRGTFVHPSLGNIWDVAFRPGSKEFVTGHGGMRRVIWWRPEAGQYAVLGSVSSWVKRLAVGPHLVCAGINDGSIDIWDLDRGVSQHLASPVDAGGVEELHMSRDETLLVARYASGDVILWDIASGVALPFPGKFGSVALSHDGGQLVAGGVDGEVLRVATPPLSTEGRARGEWRPSDLSWEPIASGPEFSFPTWPDWASAHFDEPQAQTRMADKLLQDGRLDAAMPFYRRGLALGDPNAGWKILVAEALHVERAARDRFLLDGALGLATASPWGSREALHHVITSPLASAEEKHRALSTWLDAARNDVGKLNTLAYVALRGSDLDLAAQIAQRLLAAPENADYLDTVAEIFHMRGDGDRAVEVAERAVALRPNDEGLRSNLKRFRRGHREPAAAVLRIQPPIAGPVEPERIELPLLP